MPTPATARDLDPPRPSAESWPQGVSHRATMSIGQLIGELKGEFPQLTVSKLRFLENEGLVSPVRTDSGYRKYSPADAARLRFILTAQRDRFWPLRVIRERLDALDAGEEGNALGLESVSVVPAAAPSVRRLTLADLAALCGLPENEVERMVEAGLLRPDRSGRLAESETQTVRLVAGLAPLGIEPRHLRPLVHAVGQEVELIEQATAVLRHRRDEDAREGATQRADELAGTMASLHTALLRGALRDRG